MWVIKITYGVLIINAYLTGSCLEVSGFVAGGGAIELVAEKGCITISKKHSGFYHRQIKKTVNVVAVECLFKTKTLISYPDV